MFASELVDKPTAEINRSFTQFLRLNKDVIFFM